MILIPLLVSLKLAYLVVVFAARVFSMIGAIGLYEKAIYYADVLSVYYEIVKMLLKRDSVSHYIPSVG